MSSRHRFLVDSVLSGPGEYSLDPQEAHHAVSVLRLKPGQTVTVFDGRGGYADGELCAAGKKEARVRIREVCTEAPLPYILTIASAIPKGKRWQMLVEKCTELGADRILPLLTERSVVKGEGDPEKWRRWAAEAAKQSRRARLPDIPEPVSLAAVLSEPAGGDRLLILADPEGLPAAEACAAAGPFREAVVLVGPEGGFTAEEAEACRRAGARGIRLSPYILRIETAAAAACAILRGSLT